LPDYTIVEQEHQKKARSHRLTSRPDIIIHEPFNSAHVAVVELKLRASPAEALADFGSLPEMLSVLRYRVGVFVNIGSAVTHADSYLPKYVRV
jgi:hypothetical protein